MTSVIVNPSTEAGDQLAAVRTFARLQHTKPSEAAPLTDEDLEIFVARLERIGKQFEFFVKASYLDYSVFYGGEMGKAIERCRERL